MNLWLVTKGVVYLLGYDYFTIINETIKNNRKPCVNFELLLQRSEVTCKDLEKIFNFSGSNAYHHITLLIKIGALKIRNEGKTIYYS